MGTARNDCVSLEAGALWLALLVVLGIAGCRGGLPADPLERVRLALPAEAGDWRMGEAATVYDPESIFSYIDGHAEVYLAYGMRRCLAQRYGGPEGQGDIVLDVFEMASAADAYGVSTMDREGDPVDVGNDGLVRAGWLSFWKGPFFVSLYAEEDGDAQRGALRTVAEAVAVAIGEPGSPPPIIAELPAEGVVPGSTRFLRSPQILNQVVYLGDDNPLALQPDTSAVIAQIERPEGTGHLLLVDYPSGRHAERALQSFRRAVLGGVAENAVEIADEGWFGAAARDRRLVAVLAASNADLVRTLIAERMEGGVDG